jgi:hypothetical protein
MMTRSNFNFVVILYNQHRGGSYQWPCFFIVKPPRDSIKIGRKRMRHFNVVGALEADILNPSAVAA